MSERIELHLGDRCCDVTHRALVMAILNRTVDSFYDHGAYYDATDFYRRAEQLVTEGADVLEIGAQAGGVGTQDVSLDQETELVCSAVAELRRHFDVPIAVDTWRASVAAAALDTGAVLANDMSGFSDPDYLAVVAEAGASVIATHIRLAPRVADPDPFYVDVVKDVADALRDLAGRAESAGIPRTRIIVDPGLDLGKSWQQSLQLLSETDTFASLGYTMMLAASNKIFLGRVLDLDSHERGYATLAACAFAVTRGARLLRVHDVLPVRHTADLLSAVSSAGIDV